MKTINVWILCATLLILSSCAKENGVNDILNNPNPNNPQQVDGFRQDFAKTLAHTLAIKEVRMFLKEQALLEVNGDSEILFDQVKNIPITNDQSLSELLEISYRSLHPNSDFNAAKYFGSFAHSLDPLLTIRIPDLDEVSADEWNPVTHVPDVVYMTKNHDEKTHLELAAFNTEGISKVIPVHPEPLEMVIVIKENERMIALDPTTKTDVYGKSWQNEGFSTICQGDQYHYYRYVELLNQKAIVQGNHTQPIVETEHNSRSNYRDYRNNRENMYSFRWANCTAWKKNCDWLDGKCEIEGTSVTAISPYNAEISTLKKGFDAQRRNFISTGKNKCKNSHKPKTYIIEQELGFKLEYINWKLDEFGDVQKYEWVERDGGNISGGINVEIPAGKFKLFGISIPFPKLSAEIKIEDRDDELYGDWVYYTDPKYTRYSTGRVLFTVFE